MRSLGRSTTVVSLAALLLLAPQQSAHGREPASSGRMTRVLAGTVAARTSFQGFVTDSSGTPLQGTHDFAFQLWDDGTAGAKIGADIPKSGVTVTDGYFSVQLDVPPDAFDGGALWLRIGVDGGWLSPRQEILPTPYALGLRPGARIEGSSTDPIASVANLGLGVGLRAQGSTIGVSAAGMTGVKGEGDVAVLGEGIVGVRGQGEPGHGVEGESTAAAGVFGESQGGYGVEGKGHFSDGVHGSTTHGFSSGVSGTGPTGVFGSGAVVGVSGYSEGEGMTGVLGSVKGDNAKAVVAQATGYGATGVQADAQFGTGVVASGEIGLKATSTVGTAIVAEGPVGLTAYGMAQDGIVAKSDGPLEAAAVRGEGTDEAHGGYFTSKNGAGLGAYGFEGIHGESTDRSIGVGVHGMGATGVKGDGENVGVGGEGSVAGVWGTGFGDSAHGVSATGSGDWLAGAALYAENFRASRGMAAHLKNTSDFHTAHIVNGGTGGVLYIQNHGDAAGVGGGDFITAVGREAEGQFRVTSSGQARSDVGFTTPAEDFAELVAAVAGLEPGDVLAIGPDARLVRADVPYQTNVAGVYSTAPGFLGGQPVDGTPAGHVPLAIVGIVPVKASAENGPIRPGDLLVSAGTPGRAMRAGPNPPPGSVLGKAMGHLDSGTGRIQMLAAMR